MQLLDLNVNWSDFLSVATDLVLMACLATFAIASALILVYAAMLASEMKQRRTPAHRIMRPSVVWVHSLLQRL